MSRIFVPLTPPARTEPLRRGEGPALSWDVAEFPARREVRTVKRSDCRRAGPLRRRDSGATAALWRAARAEGGGPPRWSWAQGQPGHYRVSPVSMDLPVADCGPGIVSTGQGARRTTFPT